MVEFTWFCNNGGEELITDQSWTWLPGYSISLVSRLVHNCSLLTCQDGTLTPQLKITILVLSLQLQRPLLCELFVATPVVFSTTGSRSISTKADRNLYVLPPTMPRLWRTETLSVSSTYPPPFTLLCLAEGNIMFETLNPMFLGSSIPSEYFHSVQCFGP